MYIHHGPSFCRFFFAFDGNTYLFHVNTSCPISLVLLTKALSLLHICEYSLSSIVGSVDKSFVPVLYVNTPCHIQFVLFPRVRR
jgi:hypothetical protein